jgi:dTDP-4-amino-4,6-dideoxygalactose transaminase
MKKINYKIWPLGKLKKYQQRNELNLLKTKGYKWSDPWDAVELFEDKVAQYAGSKYAISCDCCSHGIFLVLKFLKAKKKITIPKRTYVSIPMQIKHAGCNIIFKDILWNGVYRLDPYPLWDFAGRWTKNMFNGEFNILSFQLKKRIPIGRGGMILTNDRKAAEWLRKARYDGRNLRINYIKNNYSFLGWHYYMTPEDAARGILLMDKTPSENKDLFSYKNYNDLSKFRIFK